MTHLNLGIMVNSLIEMGPDTLFDGSVFDPLSVVRRAPQSTSQTGDVK